MPMFCCDPYYSEEDCRKGCIKCCTKCCCYTCWSKVYSKIIAVFAFLMTLAGGGDIVLGIMYRQECPENAYMYTTLMLAQGVMSIICGILIIYTVGRAHAVKSCRSGLLPFQYACVAYTLVVFVYMMALGLSYIQYLATSWTSDACSDYTVYFMARMGFIALVPFSPVILLPFLLLFLLCYIVCAVCKKKSNYD